MYFCFSVEGIRGRGEIERGRGEGGPYCFAKPRVRQKYVTLYDGLEWKVCLVITRLKTCQRLEKGWTPFSTVHLGLIDDSKTRLLHGSSQASRASCLRRNGYFRRDCDKMLCLRDQSAMTSTPKPQRRLPYPEVIPIHAYFAFTSTLSLTFLRPLPRPTPSLPKCKDT